MQSFHSMSMDVCLWLFLCSLFTTHAWAGPLSTAPVASLAPYLANNVPSCAQSCLQSFVADSFPSSVCSSPSINCLCTSDSETGYTIGEGALNCLASDCPEWDQEEAVSAYEVCSNVDGAMPNTHSTITATYTAVTTVSDSTSTRTPTSDNSHHPSFTSTTLRHSTSSSSSFSSSPSPSPASLASISASSIDSAIITATYSSPSSSTLPPSSVLAAPASTSSSPRPTPILTKPQVAGVVVASIGAAALAFGLCFLLFCYRRRKQERPQSGSSFGGDKLANSSVDSTPDLAIIAARDFGHDPEGKEVVTQASVQSPPERSAGTPQTTGEGGWSQWRRNTAPQDIGLALAPADLTRSHPSPITPSSRRTRNSQLLPEKPSYSLFPPPLRPSPQSRRASQSLEAQLASRNALGKMPSPTKISNPRFPGSLDTSQTYMQGDSNSRSSSSPPQTLPYMKTASSESNYQPYRREPTPDPTTGPHWSEAPGVLVRKPLQARVFPSARGHRLGQSIHGQRSSVSRPYPQPTPADALHLNTISTNTPRRKKSDPRPTTWFSTGSETSFEDADDVPEPVSALTPVKEQHSPIAYPSIPVTAAESPTRRPQLPDRSDSLLARRRGEQRAAEITDGINPRSAPQVVRHSAKWQILQSPVLSEPLATGSSSSNSPRAGRGAGMTPPPSGWPNRN